MTHLDQLIALRDAVRDGAVVTSDMLGAIPNHPEVPTRKHFLSAAFDRDMNAALALFAALLPGWDYLISPSNAKVFPYNDTADVAGQYGMADNPARALLLAMLEALTKKEEGRRKKGDD